MAIRRAGQRGCADESGDLGQEATGGIEARRRGAKDGIEVVSEVGQPRQRLLQDEPGHAGGRSQVPGVGAAARSPWSPEVVGQGGRL